MLLQVSHAAFSPVSNVESSKHRKFHSLSCYIFSHSKSRSEHVHGMLISLCYLSEYPLIPGAPLKYINNFCVRTSSLSPLLPPPPLLPPSVSSSSLCHYLFSFSVTISMPYALGHFIVYEEGSKREVAFGGIYLTSNPGLGRG